MRNLLSLLAALALGIVAGLAFARADTGALTADQRQLVEKVLREYIRTNPEVILEALQEMQERRRTADPAQSVAALRERADEIFRNPADPVGGNPEGDVTLVEFFDYRCGFCKRVHPVVKKLLAEDGGIRFVYKEFPILGQPSLRAARIALAARGQDRYAAFSDALMSARGELTEERVFEIATTVGLDIDELKAEIGREGAAINRLIGDNLRLADSLGIRGTPAFVVGSRIIRGAVGYDELRRAVAAARQTAEEK